MTDIPMLEAGGMMRVTADGAGVRFLGEASGAMHEVRLPGSGTLVVVELPGGSTNLVIGEPLEITARCLYTATGCPLTMQQLLGAKLQLEEAPPINAGAAADAVVEAVRDARGMVRRATDLAESRPTDSDLAVTSGKSGPGSTRGQDFRGAGFRLGETFA